MKMEQNPCREGDRGPIGKRNFLTVFKRAFIFK